MRSMPRVAALAAYLASALLMVAGGVAVGGSARADVAIDDGAPGMLVLLADALPSEHETIEPGDQVQWRIATLLDVAQTGELELEVESAGRLATDPGGLRLRIEVCATEWTEGAPVCPGGAATVLDGALSAVVNGTRFVLGEIRRNSGPFILATLSLPDPAPSALQGESATVSLGFTALGDQTAVTLTPGLPNTGASLAGPILLGSGLVAFGLVFARQRAGDRPSRSTRARS